MSRANAYSSGRAASAHCLLLALNCNVKLMILSRPSNTASVSLVDSIGFRASLPHAHGNELALRWRCFTRA